MGGGELDGTLWGPRKRVASISASPPFSNGVSHTSVQSGGWAVLSVVPVYATVPLPLNPSLGTRTPTMIESRSVATIYSLEGSLLAVGCKKRRSICMKHLLSSSRTHRNPGGSPHSG